MVTLSDSLADPQSDTLSLSDLWQALDQVLRHPEDLSLSVAP